MSEELSNLDQNRQIVAHAQAILALYGVQEEPDDLFLTPREAMNWIELEDATEPERRRLFQKLRKSATWMRKRMLRGNVEGVHIVDWRQIIEHLRTQSADVGNWSNAAEHFPSVSCDVRYFPQKRAI